MKQLDEKKEDSRKRKSIDESESDKEHDGDQNTPLISKKQRIQDHDIESSEDELKE